MNKVYEFSGKECLDPDIYDQYTYEYESEEIYSEENLIEINNIFSELEEELVLKENEEFLELMFEELVLKENEEFLELMFEDEEELILNVG